MNGKFACSCLFALLPCATAAAAGATARTGTSIDIVVSLSKRAAARLAAAHEVIGVSASFFGEPKDEAGRGAGAEDGRIAFGTVEKQLAKPGRVRIAPPEFDPARRALIAGAEPRVSIDVFSARRTLPDNLLDCAFYEDGLRAALRKPIALRCKLIGEGAAKKKRGR